MNVYPVAVTGPDGYEALTWVADTVEQAIQEIKSCSWKLGTRFTLWVDSFSDKTVTFTI